MAVKGIGRYIRLFKHIKNPKEYLINKSKRKQKSLWFLTKPLPISFEVPESLYQVFKEIFMEDVYEMDSLIKSLPPSPTIIDIGANAGFFCVQLLSKIDSAKIYAYEPMPANVSIFKQTIERNQRLKNLISLFQMAVTGTPQSHLDLYAAPTENNQVVASVFSGFNKDNESKISVPCITLTEIVEKNNLENIDLLKVDCEGSEYDIFYHTKPEIFQRIKQMVIEVHTMDDKENNIDSFNAYVQSLGYSTVYSPINNFCFALEAKRV